MLNKAYLSNQENPHLFMANYLLELIGKNMEQHVSNEIVSLKERVDAYQEQEASFKEKIQSLENRIEALIRQANKPEQVNGKLKQSASLSTNNQQINLSFSPDVNPQFLVPQTYLNHLRNAHNGQPHSYNVQNFGFNPIMTSIPQQELWNQQRFYAQQAVADQSVKPETSPQHDVQLIQLNNKVNESSNSSASGSSSSEEEEEEVTEQQANVSAAPVNNTNNIPDAVCDDVDMELEESLPVQIAVQPEAVNQMETSTNKPDESLLQEKDIVMKSVDHSEVVSKVVAEEDTRKTLCLSEESEDETPAAPVLVTAEIHAVQSQPKIETIQDVNGSAEKSSNIAVTSPVQAVEEAKTSEADQNEEKNPPVKEAETTDEAQNEEQNPPLNDDMSTSKDDQTEKKYESSGTEEVNLIHPAEIMFDMNQLTSPPKIKYNDLSELVKDIAGDSDGEESENEGFLIDDSGISSILSSGGNSKEIDNAVELMEKSEWQHDAESKEIDECLKCLLGDNQELQIIKQSVEPIVDPIELQLKALLESPVYKAGQNQTSNFVSMPDISDVQPTINVPVITKSLNKSREIELENDFVPDYEEDDV